MADPATYRPSSSDIPTDPGVYRFIDEQSRVIYVGKAKNLRNRLSSYFQDIAHLHPRTQQMVTTAAAVKWVVVNSDVEALTLEYAWIKEFAPRFNVMYRDDKSYPYLAISMDEPIPRMYITREAKRKGSRYFGPYAHVWAIRETMDLLQKVFPLRTCSRGVYQRAVRANRPCLLGYIDRCSAPCVGRITEEAHREIAQDICNFLLGKTGPILRDLNEKMKTASDDLEFEKAAKIRDQIEALKTVLTKNATVLDDDTDADVFALACDELEAAVQVFHVRAGRIRGERGWVVDRVDDASEKELMERLLQQIYADLDPETLTKIARQKIEPRSVDDLRHLSSEAIPKEILTSVLPSNSEILQQWLSQVRGARVDIRKPQRGQKKALMDTVLENAEQTLKRHKVQRVGDLTHRSQALEELYDYLDLPRAPLRIECYDISHTAGTNQMASMVVFEDGIPRKSAYRTFSIKDNPEGHSDDTAAMAEVLTRRFKRLEGESFQPEKLVSGELIDEDTGRPQRFSYRPDLVVVDGGLPQVNAAQAALEAVGADVSVIGLAKRLEEVWIPDEEFPIILPRSSPGLYLLQYLRDESHRFAIGAHRRRRAKSMTRSELDNVPGVGKSRQKRLLRAFGSVKRLKEAKIDDIAEVKGIGPKLAHTIYNHFHPQLND